MGFRFHSSDCSSETNGESHGQKERPSQKKTGRPTEAMSSAPDLTFRLTDSTGAGHGEEAQTFRFSSMTYAERSSTLDADRESTISASDRVSAPGAVGRGTFARGSLVDRDIEAIAVSKPKGERARDYKGRYRRWPGVLLLLLLLVGGSAAIAYFAIEAKDGMNTRAASYAQKKADKSAISQGSGSDSDTGGSTASKDIVSDDGVVGNPKKYANSTCELPDYQSKNGRIVAVSKNGTEVSIAIKGINWFGMETGQAIPFGLWDNSLNGTTAYQIAKFLAKNNFNAVRLPLMIDWIITNKVPNSALINLAENRAINITNYMSLLKSIVKTLQYRNIGVLISLHTLTYSDNGALWYNDDISEDDFLGAVDTLTTNLCSSEYWNVMGLDMKNEPYKGTWGDDSATDFRAGAKRIAARMLKGCSSWMGFVEGVASSHSLTIDGEDFSYYDWYGGGLQGAKSEGLEFSVENKVVWAPHYYTPAVYPQMYFYGGGTVSNGIQGYVELDDTTLRARIKATMNDMFGFLATGTSAAVLLGEFGGLYSKDAHPLKTTQRITDFTIEIIKATGYAGGFVWSLNPESAYQYNPADTPGTFTEGILLDDWLQANDEFLAGMAAMDDMPDRISFPCFDTTGSGSSSG